MGKQVRYMLKATYFLIWERTYDKHMTLKKKQDRRTQNINKLKTG